MSRVCELSGKRKMYGNNVSHAMNKTRRTYETNLIKKTFFIPETGESVTLRICASTLKTINRIGISEAIKRAKEKGTYKK